LIFFTSIIFFSIFFLRKNSFIHKNFFSDFYFIETGVSLGGRRNLIFLTLTRFFIFICFFNIRKILTSISFSIRKLYLRSSTKTANFRKYILYLLILK
jgi:hypothetical protein